MHMETRNFELSGISLVHTVGPQTVTCIGFTGVMIVVAKSIFIMLLIIEKLTLGQM